MHSFLRSSPVTDKISLLRLIARLNVGGPAIHTILLTQLLNPERFDSTLVAGQISPSEGDMTYLAEDCGIEPVFLPELGREIHWRKDIMALWKLFRLLRTRRPTIVHTHTAKAGMLGRLAAKLAGVPIVLHTFHGHVFHSYFSRSKTRCFLGIERWLAGFTDAVITLSPKQRQEILDYGIGRPEKVHAIGLGLDLKSFVDSRALRGRLRRELQLSDDLPLVGIVARLVPVKGLSYFLQAAKLLVQDRPECIFVIVGDGELRETLERDVEKLGIRNNVRFLGFRRELPEIYADLDCAVLSSLNEGLPVALIEAMSSGKPVVATEVGGVGDLVQHGRTGLLVPPKDSAALAEAILRLLSLSREKRAEMGDAARRSVYPKYHISSLTTELEKLYNALLEAKQPCSR